MLIIKILTIALWILAGILILIKGKIDKFDFIIVWATLIFNLIVGLFK